MRRNCAIAIMASASVGPALADDSVHLAMSNRIGLIAYCQSQGLLADAVAKAATQRVTRARDQMPAPNRATPEASAKREEAGRRGTWGTRGVTVERLAPTLGLTVAQFCAEQAE